LGLITDGEFGNASTGQCRYYLLYSGRRDHPIYWAMQNQELIDNHRTNPFTHMVNGFVHH